jgi:hypothetical protein
MYRDRVVLNLSINVLFALTLAMPLAAVSAAEIPAFPGAEGFGAYTPGGRGGTVYEVTNLNDSGPGSLRDAVKAKGPRTVVFRVSGNIELQSSISIREPYITIAGQTAPGDGICLKNYQMSVGTNDVIIRYMRFRPGDESGADVDALGGRGCENVIIDHCSASWSIDECVSFYHNSNITIQWCLVSESLYQSHHAKGHHGFGGIWGGTNASLHHNLFAHHSSRNPRFASDDKNIDYRNNVIYNWGYNSAYGGERARVNMIANYYKSGPATRDKVRDRIVQVSNDEGRWYITGNYVAGYAAITANNWNGGVHGKADKETIKADSSFPAARITNHTAEEAYELVLADVGANMPKRDSADTRIIEEIRTGTATYGGIWGEGKGIIDSQMIVGGWPQLNSATPPVDSDHDGMPDDWELVRTLDPSNAEDGAEDQDGDSYTNLEEYLNWLVRPTITISVPAPEALESGDVAKLLVTRTGYTSFPLTVSFSVGGTATQGEDYTVIGSSVVISTGSWQVTITLSPADDAEAEGTETIVVNLLDNSDDYRLGASANAIAHIVDND